MNEERFNPTDRSEREILLQLYDKMDEVLRDLSTLKEWKEDTDRKIELWMSISKIGMWLSVAAVTVWATVNDIIGTIVHNFTGK